MKFQTTFRNLFSALDSALFFAMLLATLFTALAGSAQAQTCSANMTFGDPNSPRYLSSGTVAFKGFVTGNVYGRLRENKLTDFDLRLDPDVNGPNGLRLMLAGYNASQSLTPPRFSCRATATGAIITITNVPTAKQYFSSESTYSLGLATVEIRFDKTGPGRLRVSYRHKAFSRADTTPPKPYNGRIVDAVPQGGARLTITNLP